MPDDSPSAPAPGWYPHPADIGAELYWDGAAWTGRSRPAAPPASSIPLYGTPSASDRQASAPQPGLYAQQPAPSTAGRNPLAIASLVLGIASILVNPFLVPSILAIVFGVRGRTAAESVGTGRGLATAGLVTGIVGIGTGVLSFLSNLSDLAGLAG
ncbi:DUF4190 domain-containing protein [Rathayibacter sp. VKM Ac-2803]|uniref:DUF4190 domain-containing protein n=1 Tax=unclassified Rathayibacter TaxID=2609250 RepID=UPI00135738E7|nr:MULTISPECIES: DUF4190 domain-containing protein [unclassified Rathayibacter]MWV49729.1 DUF4190 domain-containing protein [Rathayibacter sp. VKM Ac-2803]MWV59862.1 DUF4190 domain-containing protein [Rathayibacter sp. VKM Ac-2754]